MPICKFCLLEKEKLIAAHIIPRAFFACGKGFEFSKLISEKPNSFPKKAPNGIYDETILCRECEDFFQEWDDYAINVFRKLTDKPIILDGIEVGFHLSADYKKLKLFFMSLLWRSHVSNRDFYNQVNVGVHEERLKSMLKTKSPGSKNDYSVIGYILSSDPNSVPVISPYKSRMPVPCYIYTFFGMQFIIKCASHNFAKDVDNIILTKDRDWSVIKYDFKDTKIFPTVLDLTLNKYKDLFSEKIKQKSSKEIP
jgi:hypothetical protein